MKSSHWSVVLLLLGLVVGIAVGGGVMERTTVAEDKPVFSAQKWEFKVVTARGGLTKHEDQFNELGDTGWELCAAVQADHSSTTTAAALMFVFKRAKR